MALVSFHWNRLGINPLPLTFADVLDENSKKSAIYRILGDGKYWASAVDKEKGNYDYLMFADIDHAHPEVSPTTLNLQQLTCRSKMKLQNGQHG
jgi:hypothetical protein